MAANGANDAAVHGFLHQLLHSIVRQIENNDGRGDNADGVLYRVDGFIIVWFAMWACTTSTRSREMLEEIVNVH